MSEISRKIYVLIDELLNDRTLKADEMLETLEQLRDDIQIHIDDLYDIWDVVEE